MSKRFNRIYVEITNICNLNCHFCSKDSLPKKEMSIDEFKLVINKIKDYTNTIYLHVKGEPLLHSNLDKILSICEENKIRVCITTNGTLLKKNIEVLKRYPIKHINVSLHSENNNINYFNDVFKACDELKNKTTIIYRIWALNNLNLEKNSTYIVEKIKKYYNLSEDIVNKIIHDKNIKIENNIYLDKDYEFIWPKLNNEMNNLGTCLGTRTHIAILSNGIVVPCCLDSNGIINLGNIFYENMDEILNSELFKSINNGFKNRKITCDLCKSCTFRNRFK